MNAAILDGYEGHADDLTLEEVDGASHFIADEQPQVVIDRALEFFGRRLESISRDLTRRRPY